MCSWNRNRNRNRNRSKNRKRNENRSEVVDTLIAWPIEFPLSLRHFVQLLVAFNYFKSTDQDENTGNNCVPSRGKKSKRIRYETEQ